MTQRLASRRQWEHCSGEGFDASPPQVGAVSLSFCGGLQFPWALGWLSYAPDPILGSVFLWRCFFLNCGCDIVRTATRKICGVFLSTATPL